MVNTEEYYDRIARLIRAYQTGQLDVASKAELDAWRLASKENQTLFEELNSPLHLSKAVKEMSQFDATGRLAEFEQKHFNNQPVKLWARWYKTGAAVAAAIALITISVTYYYSSQYPDINRQSQIGNQNDILPGKQGATLTLANGKKIKLSEAINGALSKEAGVTITKSADGQLIYTISPTDGVAEGTSNPNANNLNTLSTANGETYQVRLPDGTLVYLNAASSLTYPSSFVKQSKRMVKLEGEAYFSVAHNKAHPFVVKTDQQDVTVLGTEFNINAYGDDNKTTTTLLEGSVQVDATKQILLKPGQQSVLADGKLKVQAADLDSSTGWKNGIFLFYNTDMQTIMRQLARWYNIEVDMSTIPDKRFYGEISRDVKLSEVLIMLEATGDIKFKIEGRRLMLTK